MRKQESGHASITRTLLSAGTCRGARVVKWDRSRGKMPQLRERPRRRAGETLAYFAYGKGPRHWLGSCAVVGTAIPERRKSDDATQHRGGAAALPGGHTRKALQLHLHTTARRGANQPPYS